MSRYKIVIADDEPLVLVGLSSMVDYALLDAEVVASARNGKELEDAILKYDPDVVITDIKMPSGSGIDVMHHIRAEGLKRPVFLLLTSYQEFSLVQEALSLGAVEYLVKLDLTPESLTQALHKAFSRVCELAPAGKNAKDMDSEEVLRERFFIRAINGLAGDRDSFASQMQDLKIEWTEKGRYCVSYLSFSTEDPHPSSSLFLSSVRILKETIGRYYPVQVILLELQSAVVIASLGSDSLEDVPPALKTACNIVYDYFSVTVSGAVGPLVEDLFSINESFDHARLCSPSVGDGIVIASASFSPFDFSPYSEKLSKAFTELDIHALSEVMEDVKRKISSSQVSTASAIAAVSHIQHMALLMIPEGNTLIPEVLASFGLDPLSLYKAKSGEESALYLARFSDAISSVLADKAQDYRAVLVKRIQAYIKGHVRERISLADVASVYGLSQNYLSTLFSKYSEMGFVEYNTNVKIEEAKRLLRSTDMKVYEVSDALGFESAFYFSKVFRKIVGLSPREYLQEAGK